MSQDQTEQLKWIQYVAANPGAMSQRRRDTVMKWAGGVELLIKEAASRNIHLVELTDDHGVVLIGASIHEFKVLA